MHATASPLCWQSSNFYIYGDYYLDKTVMFTTIGVSLCLERKMEQRQYWKEVLRMYGPDTVLRAVRNNIPYVFSENGIFRRIGQYYRV
jgi:hypothetical protein